MANGPNDPPAPAPLDRTSLRASAAATDRFGKYLLVGPLARGGMAELSLAVQEGDGVQGFSKVVALKRVLPSQAEDAAYVQMFLDEARLAARLDHDNIVRIYDVGQAAGRYFLTMEYLPGEDLQRLMLLTESNGFVVDPDVAAAVISAAAEGLHFAHELTDDNGQPLGLVHRDISPSNVIVTYYGQVKLVDFGIAKAASNNFRTDAGVLKGKAAYFAPEQVSRGNLDRRCDIFSLGIVLWELLAGTRLFMRESHAATFAAAAVGEITSLRDFRPDVPAALEAIVMRALQRDPNDRYQTAAELHEALEGYLRGRTRPTPKDVGAWLQAVFGDGRASLKKSMARGINLRESLDSLRDLDAALARLGTQSMMVSQSRGTGYRNAPAWHAAAFAAGAVVVMAAGVVVATLSADPQPPAPLPASASLRVDSEPQGASIFVRGEPTGKVTPAVIAGLPPNESLELMVQLPSYGIAREPVTLTAGKENDRLLKLSPVKP